MFFSGREKKGAISEDFAENEQPQGVPQRKQLRNEKIP